ncbi:MAG: methyl-accepting chemotaxis protein [Synergistaceae bacterium]|nr:methyl-accepting chemotaxis protein [Synergistaceae bacterium]
MLKNMKIGTQIMLVTFLIAATAIVGLSVTSVRYFSKYAHDTAQRNVHQGMLEIKSYIQSEMTRVRVFREQVIRNQTIAAHVAARDTKTLNSELNKLMQEAMIDIIVITDPEGTVISRPHDPSRVGDNIGGEEKVKQALAGHHWETIMTAPSTKLGYYCGSPITTADGQIVGMIRTAMALDNEGLVDRIKNMFDNEVTLFAGKTRINTTLMDEDGKRMIGTDASEAVQKEVLQGGNDLELALTIFGKEYFAVYSPMEDPATGDIVGMYFNGQAVDKVDVEIRTMMMSVVVVAVIVFIVAFLLSFFTARRISKPLGQIVTLSERGRNGDLTIRKEDFQYTGGGELGALVNALSEMIAAQLKAMTQVVSTANEVTKNAGTLNSLSDENAATMSNSGTLIKKVSELCDANAEAIERSFTNVSEMATGADSVANMSTNSADSLSKTTQMSQVAVNSVNSLVGDIKLVDEKTSENQEKIRVLSSSVKEISNFMGVIGSIADQTNLLALNAAIEAARAGEAGKGFAVVAEEVRKLAEESRNASKSVEELVTLLSRNADEAISATEQSVAIVSEIKSKADAAVDGLNNALSEITNANEAIQSIAAVAQEQAASSSEISRAIEEIRHGTENITSTLFELNKLSGHATDIGESVSDSAHQMAQSAAELKDVLALFHI